MKVSEMKLRITIEKAISFTKLSVALSSSWPPPPDATKYQMLIFDLLWWLSLLSSLLLLLPLIDAVYSYSANPIVLGKSVCLCCAVAQIAIKLIVSRAQRKRFQALHIEVENFCKDAGINEINVLYDYVKKRKYSHFAYTFWCYFTTVTVICSPLFLEQTFPTYAKYPFSTENQPLKTLIYVHQSLVGFQASAGVTIVCQIALLLWYVVARFEMLTMQLMNISSERELDVCIEKHNDILRFSEAVNISTRFLVLTTVIMTTTAIIFGSLNLVTNQPMIFKMQYVVLVYTAGVELFICAWPADTLKSMSENVSWGAYSSQWYNKDVRIQRKILQIIMRSQKAKAIQINGILPQLSLSYYASFVYTSFSYFTALKVVVN